MLLPDVTHIGCMRIASHVPMIMILSLRLHPQHAETLEASQASTLKLHPHSDAMMALSCQPALHMGNGRSPLS